MKQQQGKGSLADRALVLGIDAGGTKTVALVATEQGEAVGLGRGYGANYQSVGKVRAGIELKRAIDSALQMAGPGKVVSACYGVAGADREIDFEIIRELMAKFDPAQESMLCNDTAVALRAGTDDGVGVALIGGTGSNCMGFNREGKHVKVGGMGWYCGDYGSADYIVKQAIPEAWKGFDGRGPKTLLTSMFAEALGVDRIDDIVQFEFADDFKPMFWHQYAKVVFEAARRGDKTAIKLLRATGKLAAGDALGCIRQLFKRGEAVTVVLGGSVYQKGRHPALVNGLTDELARRWPTAKVIKLRQEPIVGAALWALDHLLGRPAGRKRTATLRRTHKVLEASVSPLDDFLDES
ncbi:MAG: BadF/BadG/BcrA/BcrD ATPase family protein [Candidatus Alcyoniella australis]|nr:BadF/BadG/BcrA/BcrD ATPase family protein [Candidatus Alcyoniella australis]